MIFLDYFVPVKSDDNVFYLERFFCHCLLIPPQPCPLHPHPVLTLPCPRKKIRWRRCLNPSCKSRPLYLKFPFILDRQKLPQCSVIFTSRVAAGTLAKIMMESSIKKSREAPSGRTTDSTAAHRTDFLRLASPSALITGRTTT